MNEDEIIPVTPLPVVKTGKKRDDATEREAIRLYLRRQIIACEDEGLTQAVIELKRALAWVVSRHERYRTRKGGL